MKEVLQAVHFTNAEANIIHRAVANYLAKVDAVNKSIDSDFQIIKDVAKFQIENCECVITKIEKQFNISTINLLPL